MPQKSRISSHREDPRICVDGCFLAGTLVHTKEGPVPIEQIKIGDWVLSQPETKGDLAYKRVARTFVHDDKAIRRIDYVDPATPDKSSFVYTTGNHPFWVEEAGWACATSVEPYAMVELASGSHAYITDNKPVYRTSRPNVGWAAYDSKMQSEIGWEWDFAESRLVANNVPRDGSIQDKPDCFLKARVHNFEVEDFNTYYAGKLGIWVHSKGVSQEAVPESSTREFADDENDDIPLALPFECPAPKSMTVADASKWYRQMVPMLANMLGDAQGDVERLNRAWQLKSGMRKAARLALYDPGLAAEFHAAFALPTVEQLLWKCAAVRSYEAVEVVALQTLITVTEAEHRQFPGTIGEAIGMEYWDGKQAWVMTDNGWMPKP